MPSWAVASIRPARSIACRARRARLLPGVGQRLELAASGRHGGELGADEEGVAPSTAPADDQQSQAGLTTAPPARVSDSLGLGSSRARRDPVDPVVRPCRRPVAISRGRTVSPTGGTRPSPPSPSRRRSRRRGRRGSVTPNAGRAPRRGATGPGTVHDPSRRLASRWLRAVVLVVTSPTISSTRSSRVTTPDGAAVLVDDDGELHAALAQLEQQWVEPQRLGHEHRRHHQRRDRHVGAPVERHRDRLLDVHDAVDVVRSRRRRPGTGECPCAGPAAPGRRRSRCARSGSPATAASSRRRRSGRRTRGMPVTSRAVLPVEGARLGRARAPARPALRGCGRATAPPGARCRAPAGSGWRRR